MVESAAADPAGQTLEILRRRAAALARVGPGQGRDSGTQVIEFALGDERFAVHAASVLQVAVLRELTPLPGAPPPLFGVTHWRGQLLIVLDLRSALGVRVRGVTDLGRLIVFDGVDRPFGVLADAVHQITELDEQRLRALPQDSEVDGASLLRGIHDDGMLVLDTAVMLERFGSVRSHRDQNGTRRTR
ncbi:N/A [soil metagenome]